MSIHGICYFKLTFVCIFRCSILASVSLFPVVVTLVSINQQKPYLSVLKSWWSDGLPNYCGSTLNGPRRVIEEPGAENDTASSG